MSRKIVVVSEEQSDAVDDLDLNSDMKTNSESDKRQVGDNKSNPNDNDSVSSTPLNDEEDVPSDFFDDFSNQDFMAGLDIVDAWDDEEEEITNKSNKRNTSGVSKNVDRNNSETNRKPHCYSPIRAPNRSDYNDRRNKRSRVRSRDRKNKRKSKENRIVKERDSDDHRRDPEKTKRDIQKDKDKCTKDKEARIISEKLKVVETGLVPPGMEMEIDLKQIKSVVKEQNKRNDAVSEEKPKDKRSGTREKAQEERKREDKGNCVREERRRRSRSFSAEIYRSRIRSYRRSRSREDERRFNRTSRSPLRRRSRSPYRRRISSERKFQVDERRRHYRDVSPLVIKRSSRGRSRNHSRSRNNSRSRHRSHSNVSEREMWLRKREYKRDHNVSSPTGEIDSKKYKRGKESFMEELVHILDTEKKKKVFKEVQERINEPRKTDSPHQYRLGPVPVPAPLPVPAPVLNPPSGLPPNPMLCPPPGYVPNQPRFPFLPQVEPPIQYDQQFFIGQPEIFHNNDPYARPFIDPSHHIPSNVVDTNPTSTGMMVPNSIDSPIKINLLNSRQNNVDILKNQQSAEAQKQQQEAVTKLFEDKKISLSDFLTVTAKPADPCKPINVEKKVKVLSLCQDAIKALGGESKLSGRFFLKKIIKESEKKEECKYQSPVRKIPIVRFRFTTISKGGEEKSSLESNLDKLLASLGRIKPAIVIKSDLTTSNSTTNTTHLSTKSVNLQSVSAPASTIVPSKLTPRKYDPLLGRKYQMKMSQTDPYKCQVCEIRKTCKYTNQGVQCDIRTVDVSTQITEEDKIRWGVKDPPIKDALKNQSLAHLTAAQILAAQNTGGEDMPRKELFPAARRITPPPPPNISPEKQNVRLGLSHNDSFPVKSFNSPDSSSRRDPKIPSIFDKIFNKPYEGNYSRAVDLETREGRGVDSRPPAFEARTPTFEGRDGGRDRDRYEDGRDRFADGRDRYDDLRDRYEDGRDRFGKPRIKEHEVQFEPPPNIIERGFVPPMNNRGSFGPFAGSGRRY